MSAIAAPSNLWHIDYHRTMAATLEACQAVSRGTGIVLLARDFWRVARDFKALLSDLDRVTEVPAQELTAIILRLEELYRSVSKALDLASKRGLANRTLTGNSLHLICAYNSRLCDVIECFKVSQDPAIAAATKEALEEYERGETVSWDSLV